MSAELLHFHMHAIGLKPELEYQFHDTRKWRFDFAWPDRRIAAEVEGGVYSGGRHTRSTGFIKDAEKYNMATELGWWVFRFPGDMVKSGEAVNQMERVLALQGQNR